VLVGILSMTAGSQGTCQHHRRPWDNSERTTAVRFLILEDGISNAFETGNTIPPMVAFGR